MRTEAVEAHESHSERLRQLRAESTSVFPPVGLTPSSRWLEASMVRTEAFASQGPGEVDQSPGSASNHRPGVICAVK
jgi:hypothetical protein